MTTTRIRVPARGFTMIEMAVVLAVLGLLLLFTLPRVAGSADFANGEKAKTTASGALDVVSQLAQGVLLTSGRVPTDGDLCDNPPSTGARTQMNRDHTYSQDELKLIETREYVAGMMAPGSGYAASPIVPTNCPAFVNPSTLAGQTGDVRFIRGDQSSADAGTASVAAWPTNIGWRVAVAVLAPPSSQAIGSCWIVTRDFPATDGYAAAAQTKTSPGVAAEEYYVNATITATSPTACTASGAQAYEIDTLCHDLSGTPGAGPIGKSWRRPCATVTT